VSPYLFILCAEGLSCLIKNKEDNGFISGCSISPRSPSISHLFFAYNSLLFFKSFASEAYHVKQCLKDYEGASGQCVNFQKSSIIFSRNTPHHIRSNISVCLNVPETLDQGLYLGLPSQINRKKRSIFTYIEDRIRHRLGGWKKGDFIEVGCAIDAGICYGSFSSPFKYL
jgi:hypothetical protein